MAPGYLDRRILTLCLGERNTGYLTIQRSSLSMSGNNSFVAPSKSRIPASTAKGAVPEMMVLSPYLEAKSPHSESPDALSKYPGKVESP